MVERELEERSGVAQMAAAFCGPHAAGAGRRPRQPPFFRTFGKVLGGEQKIAGLKGLSLRADYRRELSAGAGGGGTMTMVMMGRWSASGSQQTNV